MDRLDRISLAEIAQAGPRALVSALHEIPYGEVWSRKAIRERQSLIRASALGLEWKVVESLPVHEDIKSGQGNLDRLFANYRESMANLAACGVATICYNFMPLLDWTRTTLDWPMSGGGKALRFSAVEMAAFDVFMLQRPGAEADHGADTIAQAERWHRHSSESQRERLLSSIMAGLPGAYDRYDIRGLREALKRFDGLTHQDLRSNLARFLREIIPAAQDVGIRMCIHPDDPPRDILGLPRIVSDAEDIAWILDAVDARENGLTICSGSLGARPENDLPAIARRFAGRIHFAHLRNVSNEPDGSFHEAEHLSGDVDMVALLRELLAERDRRAATGDGEPICFRPDHGHELGSDLGRGTHPGYPYIGRLKGLAELRGIIAALAHRQDGSGVEEAL